MAGIRERKDGVPMLALDTLQLAEALGCGRVAAETLGKEAGARIRIGRRVLWNVKKIQEYMDSISE